MIFVKKASQEDSIDLFEWRNDPLTRKMFRTDKLVSLKEHDDWFKKKLNNKNSVLYICMIDKKKIASVRFDINLDTADVSINLSPSFRRMKLSEQCLNQCIKEFKNQSKNVKKIIAEIKMINKGSIKIFEKNNFKIFDSDSKYIYLEKLINQ